MFEVIPYIDLDLRQTYLKMIDYTKKKQFSISNKQKAIGKKQLANSNLHLIISKKQLEISKDHLRNKKLFIIV